MKTHLRARLMLFLKGMAMGIADSVPGVSGGTIALIVGIYEELIFSIRNINPRNVPVLWREGPARFWQVINGNFLLTLLLGILSSLLLAAGTVLYLLDNFFVLVMAFFIGLVFASTWLLSQQIQNWTPTIIAFILLGAAISLLSAFANPLQGDTSLVYLFFCGVIAICAMILPGISGAFILILLGVYNYVLDALRTLQFDIILVFASGCVLGLLSFAHVLTWTFAHYRQPTYAFLSGMLLASVAILWPWKELTAGRQAGISNLLPWQYEAATGQSSQLLLVLLFTVVGFTLIVLVEQLANPHQHEPLTGK